MLDSSADLLCSALSFHQMTNQPPHKGLEAGAKNCKARSKVALGSQRRKVAWDVGSMISLQGESSAPILIKATSLPTRISFVGSTYVHPFALDKTKTIYTIIHKLKTSAHSHVTLGRVVCYQHNSDKSGTCLVRGERVHLS